MKRLMVILLLLVLLLPAAVGAQVDTLGLSPDDALLLATANRAPLESFAFDFSFQLAANLDTFTLGADVAGIGMVDRAAHALALVQEGDIKLGTMRNIPLDGELRLVDDTLYLSRGGWQGLAGVSSALASAISSFTGLEVDAAALAVWDITGVDGLSDMLNLIAADPAAFISAQRLEDVDGAAQFQLTADLHALFDTDSFAEAISTLGQAQGSDLILSTPEEVAAMVRENNAAVTPATLTVTQVIGLDDALIHGVTIHLYMEVAPEAAGFSSVPFTVEMMLDLALSQQNQPQTIAAPEGAALVPQLTLETAALPTPEDGDLRTLTFATLDADAVYSESIDLQVGDVVTITARRLSLDVDTVLTLLSPAGEVAAENDDHEAPAYFTSAYDSQIVAYEVTESGTYTVEVSDLSGLAGSFMLTLHIEH